MRSFEPTWYHTVGIGQRRTTDDVGRRPMSRSPRQATGPGRTVGAESEESSLRGAAEPGRRSAERGGSDERALRAAGPVVAKGELSRLPGLENWPQARAREAETVNRALGEDRSPKGGGRSLKTVRRSEPSAGRKPAAGVEPRRAAREW